MATVRLYIGHNHVSGTHTDERVYAALAEAVEVYNATAQEAIEGWTTWEAMGVYKGERELSTVAEFSMLSPRQVEGLRGVCAFLNRELHQECIGFMATADEMEYI